jgi:hypothetical protein
MLAKMGGKMTNTNQAKTHVRLKELTETTEKKTSGMRGVNLSRHEYLAGRDGRLPRSDGARYRED